MANEYPWAGRPRKYSALAMPNGERRFGVSGPIVSVRETYSSGERERLYSREEAAQLRDELSAALRAFDVAEELAGGVIAEIAARPRAHTGHYPIRTGGTLAEVGLEGET